MRKRYEPAADSGHRYGPDNVERIGRNVLREGLSQHVELRLADACGSQCGSEQGTRRRRASRDGYGPRDDKLLLRAPAAE